MSALRSRYVVPALLALLTCGHFFFLARHVHPGIASPDADGYYAQARLIFQEGRLAFEPASPAEHLGMHWIEKPDGSYISRYPAGLPVLIGAVWTVAGRDASFYVNAALAALTLPALYLLALPYIGAWPALAAAAVQAANPTANFHAAFGDAHTAACFFLVLGWMLLDRWRRTNVRWLGIAGGFALAVVPTVRYAEAAAAIGAVVFLALLWRQGRRDVVWPVLGALPPGLALAAINTVQFGAPWRTAYTLTGESNLSWRYFVQNWNLYIESILTSGVGLFAVLGALGAIVMFRERDTRPLAAGLGLSALAITLVYMGYYSNAGAGMSGARFLLPTLPLYLPPAIWFLHRAVAGRTFAVVLAGLVLLQAGMGARDGLTRLQGQAAASERAAMLLVGLEEFVPAGAVLLADRFVQEPVHFTGLWKQADLSILDERRGPMAGRPPGPFGMGGQGDADRPMPMQPEKGKALRARYEGLQGRERTAMLLADLEAWADPDDAIYLAAYEDQPNPALRALRRGATLTPVGRIEISEEAPPDAMLPRGRRRPGPGFPPPPGFLPGAPALRNPMQPFSPASGPLTVYQVRPR